MTTTVHPQRSSSLAWGLRIGGALLLVAMAVVHAHLWRQGYADIAVIGPSFLLNAALGGLGALLLLVVPRRWLLGVTAAGALLAAGSLAALVASTTVGLFGFVESTSAQLWWTSFWIEAAAVAVLAFLTGLVLRRRR